MHAVLIGLGNIGSQAAALVGRLPVVTRMTLIDGDRYEARNLASQAIMPAEVGELKARVWAKRLRALRPELKIEAIPKRVEAIPMGKLRGDVLLAAVDTRLTRQHINQAAWTLGMPWIDAGVQADGGLVRVELIEPAEGAPCYECSWDDRHYNSLEAAFPCRGFADTPATNAPAGLGALAAALMTLECRKLLAGARNGCAAGQQIVLDTEWRKFRVTKLRRNPACRFHHGLARWEPLQPAPGMTMAQLLELGGGGVRFSVLGAGGFVKSLRCGQCAKDHALWRLRRELRPEDTRCRRCGARMEVAGFDLADSVGQTDMPATLRARPLHRFGFRAGELVLFAGEHRDRLLLIGGDADA
jgi:molybdopterin/thiamine biosynthesis adenylyltransferase